MNSEFRTQWTIKNIALERLARADARPFVTEVGGSTESYAEFISRAARLANALIALGVRRGDMVALLCPNGLPHLHAWLACALAGAVEVPINPALRGEPLRHVLNLAKPRVAFVDSALLKGFFEAGAGPGFPRSGGLLTTASPAA